MPFRAFPGPGLRKPRGCRPAIVRAMPADIAVTVMLFASLREAAGADRVTLRIPAATPVGAVWDHLPEPMRSTPPPRALRYALNDRWIAPGQPMTDGDRVALVLPVSGG
jgi:molybdopterin converting factor small subunit